MTTKLGDHVKVAAPADHWTHDDVHHEDLRFYVHHTRRKYWAILASVAAMSALLSFAVTWAIASSRPVKVTFSLPPVQPTSATSTPTSNVTANNSGQSALTEAQLRAEVKNVGGSIFWAGAMPGALYTYSHIKSGQDFIRYLPNGQGLSDKTQNYRVIATYKEATAYATILAASKLGTGVSLTNPDGSIIYYAKATPTHVYMAFKNFDYQIEIFDPVPGASLKLATTPGAIKAII